MTEIKLVKQKGVFARRAAASLLPTIAAGVLVSGLAGCAGGGNGPALYTIYPQQLPGGNRVAAGQTINMSAVISNSSTRSPRFIVEKPTTENFIYDLTQPISATNYPHGTVDDESGVYQAPSYIAYKSPTYTKPTIDVVYAVSSDTYASLVNNRLSLVTRLTTAKAAGSAALASASQNAANQYGPRMASVALDYVNKMLYLQLTPADGPSKIPQGTLATSISAVANQEWNDLIGLQAQGLNSTQAASVSLNVYDQVVLNPSVTSATTRTTTNIANFVQVAGDACSAATTSVACPTLTPAQDATYTIEDPTLGAGGSVDNKTGIYTAPNSLPDQARIPLTGGATPTAQQIRRAQDIILVTSNVDPTAAAEVTVNVVTGGENLQIN